MRKRLCALTLAVAVLGLSTGCAQLSLFSSTHEHRYAPQKETQKRLTRLENKVGNLEGRFYEPDNQ